MRYGRTPLKKLRVSRAARHRPMLKCRKNAVQLMLVAGIRTVVRRISVYSRMTNHVAWFPTLPRLTSLLFLCVLQQAS